VDVGGARGSSAGDLARASRALWREADRYARHQAVDDGFGAMRRFGEFVQPRTSVEEEEEAGAACGGCSGNAQDIGSVETGGPFLQRVLRLIRRAEDIGPSADA